MYYETFAEAHTTLLWASFVIAMVMGGFVNKSNFCTMGAVSDVVNMGDWRRMRAWLLAIAVAMIGVLLLEKAGVTNLAQTFPPYRSSSFAWVENLFGGFIFGIGMTLASGCGNKTLIRIGGGNLKSVMVLAIIAVIAYYMTNPFPGSDKTLYSVLFYGWTNPLSASLTSEQDLGAVIGGEGAATLRLVIGGIIAALLLFFVFKAADFRASIENILGGLAVGLSVIALWYVSSAIAVDVPDDAVYSLGNYYVDWDFLSESSAGKPAAAAPLSAQSFTFINPMGQTFGYAIGGFSAALLTVGIMTVAGVIVGSFLAAIAGKGFRVEWFSSVGDFVNHLIGAILMGFGGVLAMGCTIGQGITGVSTLAMGSFLTFFAIVFGSALTMKVQYYKMVYEEEATFAKALITALVDLHLLPAGMRKLEAV